MDNKARFHHCEDIDLKNEFRIKYYLGNVNKEIILREEDLKTRVTLFDDTRLLRQKTREDLKEDLQEYYSKYVKAVHYFDPYYVIYSCYYDDLYTYLRNYWKKTGNDDVQYIFWFGDDTSFKDLPCFIKAKTIENDDCSVLLKLNTTRHIAMVDEVIEDDIPYHLKSNKLVWRGTSTGPRNPLYNKRINIVDKFYDSNNPDIDIKFSYLCQSIQANPGQVDRIMSLKELLEHKFLISIEGNDVASNLKWILLSNSVCLMPEPTACSWFMEDMLIPFFHYVPLEDDFSDLEQKYDWCLNNLDECEAISQNATKYMENFLDDDNEEYITTRIINTYFNNVKFTP